MARHRGIRRGAPVRTGLLGVCAAVALGAVGVATGLLPGGEAFTAGDTSADGRPAQAGQAPRLTTQGDASANAERPAGRRTGAPVKTGEAAAPAKPSAPAAPKAAPSAAPKPPAAKPAAPAPAPPPAKTAAPAPEPTVSKTPAVRPTRAAPAPQAPKPPAPPAKPAAPKPAPAPKPPAKPSAPAPSPSPTTRPPAARETAAEAEVIRLVNVERAKVGCSPVRSNASLASLAGAFSTDMAARDFFDHTDPDGATPWSRAAKAGITNLGAENIARGQVDAAAVMASWMASDGHRANILNCTYTSMGVGVHFGDGGPWWTQDFGL